MLARLAYRMLGSQSDADDVMQEAYLQVDEVRPRWGQIAAGLSHSIVTHLCIDQRQAVDERKQTYVGPWLPEPIVETGQPGLQTGSKRPSRCRWRSC